MVSRFRSSFIAGFAALLLLSSGILAACGNASQGSEKVTLKLITFANPTLQQGIADLNNDFHAKYPNITVQVEAVNSNDYPNLQNTRLAAKNVDIMAISTFGYSHHESYAPSVPKSPEQQLVEANQLLDLTGQPFLKNFYPQAITDTATLAGKVWQVPTGTDSFNGIYYSKSLFQKYNLTVPTTWSDFVALCQKLQANGVNPMTTGGKDGWPPGVLIGEPLEKAFYPDLHALDQGLFNGSIKFTDPKGIQILQRAQQIWSFMEPGFAGISYDTVVSRLVSGKVAMLPDGSWEAAAIAQADPTFQFGYFPFPLADSADQNSFFIGKYDTGFTIPSSSAHQDAALKWMAFYSDPANYGKFIRTFGLIPTQPNIDAGAFYNSIATLTAKFQLAPELVLNGKQHAGQYAGFSVTALAPLGTFTDVNVLAAQEQKDWDAGTP